MKVRRAGEEKEGRVTSIHELTMACLCTMMLLQLRNFPAEFLPAHSVSRAGLPHDISTGTFGSDSQRR